VPLAKLIINDHIPDAKLAVVRLYNVAYCVVLVVLIHISQVRSLLPGSNAALSGQARKSPLPSKYPLPPYVAALHDAVGLNGLKAWTDAPLPAVNVFAVVAVLVSINLFDVQVSKD
jgi:hypothetical protein